jgi:ketosteroid isomerase-like protein
MDAERAARARAADTARPEPARMAPAEPAPAPDPRAQVEQLIGEYAAALQSRDVSRVRQAYPGLTAAQAQGWRDFFASVRNLRVSLTVTTLTVAGDSAEALVGGLYEYDNATTGRAERRPVTFRATLTAQPGGWRLSAIR